MPRWHKSTPRNVRLSQCVRASLLFVALVVTACSTRNNSPQPPPATPGIGPTACSATQEWCQGRCVGSITFVNDTNNCGRCGNHCSISETVAVDIVDGIPPEYLAASRKGVGPDQWDAFEAQVRALYKQMARIKITPLWAKLLDFKTRFPTPIEKLIRRAG